MVRVELPSGLCVIARCERELALPVAPPVTQRRIIDALEQKFPMLRGTIRDRQSQKRRPFIRFFACQLDLSHMSPDAPVPDAVAAGREIYMIVGAVAGG